MMGVRTLDKVKWRCTNERKENGTMAGKSTCLCNDIDKCANVSEIESG